MEIFVLDSYAILCYLQAEKNSAIVKNILTDAEQKKKEVCLNWVNLGEIYYIIAKNVKRKKAIESIAFIKQLPIQLIESPPDLIMKAAEVKSKYTISYADAFVVATAILKGAIIITGDPEFKTVKDIVQIKWV